MSYKASEAETRAHSKIKRYQIAQPAQLDIPHRTVTQAQANHDSLCAQDIREYPTFLSLHLRIRHILNQLRYRHA